MRQMRMAGLIDKRKKQNEGKYLLWSLAVVKNHRPLAETMPPRRT